MSCELSILNCHNSLLDRADNILCSQLNILSTKVDIGPNMPNKVSAQYIELTQLDILSSEVDITIWAHILLISNLINAPFSKYFIFKFYNLLFLSMESGR